MVTLRYVDTLVPRPRWRVNLAKRVTPRLSLGVEYNPVVGEYSPTGNWIAHVQDHKWPMISFGTSSDRIGTPPGNQAFYVTFARGFGVVAPYLSINYSEFERGLNFPFGVNIALHPGWDLLPMHDGRKSHLLLTYKRPEFSVSALWIWLKRPGLSISFGF